jgi:hypothetical protein
MLNILNPLYFSASKSIKPDLKKAISYFGNKLFFAILVVTKKLVQ